MCFKRDGNSAKSPHSASDPRRQHPDSFGLGENMVRGGGGDEEVERQQLPEIKAKLREF